MLAEAHYKTNLQKQYIAFELLSKGMESDVITFAKMVAELGGVCPIIRDKSKRKNHTHGRRELQMPQYGLRMKNPDGSQKYRLAERGYVVRVG